MTEDSIILTTYPLFKKIAAFMDAVVAPKVELVACPLDIFLLLMSIVRVKLLLYLFKNDTEEVQAIIWCRKVSGVWVVRFANIKWQKLPWQVCMPIKDGKNSHGRFVCS
jgi:hypothetical protein